MCYSGKCCWENSQSGDCNFPHIKAVRDKYPLPVCCIPESESHEEYINEVIDDIRKILKNN